MLLILLALGQLVYHLARSFEGIKHPPYGQEFRGFEPLPVAQVMGPAAPPQRSADPADSINATDRPGATHGNPPQG